MTAEELYKRVCHKGRIDEEGYDFENEFLLDLEEALNYCSLKALGLSTGSKVKGKEHCIRTYLNPPAGHVGYGQKYSLPSDLIKIDRIEINVDGKCWKEPTIVDFADKKCSLHKDECNSCQACFDQCNPEVVIKGNELSILTPIKLGLPCGIKLWYTPRYSVIKTKEDSIPVDSIVADYVVYKVIMIYQQIHSDQFSTTNNNRLYALYKTAEEAFTYRYQGEKQIKKIKMKSYGLY